ncbi:MAG: hypothetical protein ABSG52_00510 [Terriglobales bacterium]|jgi:hypothetical protein
MIATPYVRLHHSACRKSLLAVKDPVLGAFSVAESSTQSYAFRVMRITVVTLLLLSLCSITSAEKIPAEAWQIGTLKDSSESWHSRSAGVISGNQSYGVHGSMISREYPIVRYTIDSDTYIYEADLVLRHAKAKQPAVTVNGSIKFAIVKSHFYIQDEEGKEFKLILVKKALKTAQPSDSK